MKARKPVLTEHELAIMQIVWQRPAVTVRDVYEELLKRRKIAYTTVMTMMGILETKGYLKRNRDAKAYVYRPTKGKSKVLGSMVSDFVNRVFDGSAKPLLVHLVENEHLSQEELDEIAGLLKEKERAS
jgi:BlaI family transcriptional regulator, penicillinase repressor